MKYVANPVEVEAWQIADVNDRCDARGRMLVLEDGSEFFADEGMIARYEPVVGDYVVKQADGYLYLNPRDVFKRKYRPKPEN